MANDAQRKRKLEQDQVAQNATPKRLKPSKADSAKKAETKANGEAAGSPVVIVSKTDAPSIDTPKSSRAEKKASKKSRESDVSAVGQSTPGGKPKKSQATPERSAGEAEDGEQAAEGATPAKSKKSTKRKPQQTDDGALVRVESESKTSNVGDAQASVSGRTDDQSVVSVSKEHRRLEKKARRKAARGVKKEEHNDGLQVAPLGDGNPTVPNQFGWSLSAPSAGRYLDHDPIFVEDENGNPCLIAATVREVQLLSLDTSLVVRSHVIPDGRSIACYALSLSDPQSVDVAYDNGTKVQWSWVTAEGLKGTFPGQETTTAMAFTTSRHDGRPAQFYIAHSEAGWTVVGERKSLYTTERRLQSIQVLDSGLYVVCLSVTAVVLGTKKNPGQPSSDYVWVELPVEMPLTCAHARLVTGASGKQNQRPDLALVVGNAEGQLHLYSNISSVFASPSKAQLPTPRILHWHREAVSAVKFSQDGNYLISGGKESVLVLWQLETGKKQFLPHLTAEVERIVVNEDGTRYALQMGDNSIMVLSSSELKPVANFAGLQLATQTEQSIQEGVVLPTTTALLHPKNPHQLLLSVPSTQPKAAKDISTRPFLQAFDARNSRHLTRQALTRNNVTDFNLGPENTAIIPPDVSSLAVSADGQWLATVDEWYPPASDLEHAVGRTSNLDGDALRELKDQQERRREVHLKFWRWDAEQDIWTLSTRADTPHARSANADPGSGAGSILKLKADPASNSFATVGEDGIVKIWRPKIRTRHGIPLKEENGSDAIDWVCKRIVPLHISSEALDRADSPMELPEESEKLQTIVDACLSFSPDGSMLACGQVSADEVALPLVHFINPHTGTLVSSKSGLVAPEQELVDIGFLDRYFVALSSGAIRVWNLVDDSHHYTITLSGSQYDQDDAKLAVNQVDETFAVVSFIPTLGSGEPTPRIEVYSPKKPECLFGTEFSTIPAALLAGTSTKGFTVVFEDGTIRTLSTSTTTTARRGSAFSLPQIEEAPPMPEDISTKETEDADVELETEAEILALPSGEMSGLMLDDEQDDRPVVRPEQLASIFDVGQSFACPPVRDMFRDVVGLFAKRPRRRLRVEEGREMEVDA